MPLREYYCENCKVKVETIQSLQDLEPVDCPKCSQKTKKLISRFAVGGQGDLRENTMHGCHDHDHSGHGHGGEDH